MIAIRGAGSVIVQRLAALLPKGECIVKVDRWEAPPMDALRYLFCQGLIKPKRITEQTDNEIAESFLVNAGRIIKECDQIIEGNDLARICVVGSESGFVGSFDGAYAVAKAALHCYVETKRLRTPRQQLVCIAPTIIWDAAMTQVRDDLETVEARGRAHPKGRWLTAREVARLIHFCLFVDEGYLSGVVLRFNGGAHTCR